MYSTNPAGVYFAEDSIPTPSAEMILELLADVQQLLKRAADTENSEDHEQLQARVSFHRHCAEEHNNYGLNSSAEDCTECNECAIQHLHTAPLAGMQRRAVPNADDSEFLYANELMNEMQPFRHFHKRCPCIHASAPKKETEAAAAESHLPTRHHQHTQVHAESTPLAVALNGARTRPMKLNIERSALMQRRKAHTS